MSNRRRSGALERSSFRSRWRDGSVDLFGGLGVLAGTFVSPPEGLD